MKFVEKIITYFLLNNFLCLFFFFFENLVVYEMCGKMLESRLDDRRQYGVFSLHAGYLRLQIHTHVFNNYCFSTATIVTRTCPHVTL